MHKKILIDSDNSHETRVVALDQNNNLEHFDYDTERVVQIKGNIYLAKIVRIEPSLQAAFIDYGSEKNGFLPFAEIHQMYYNIPSSDRVTTTEAVELKQIKQIDTSLQRDKNIKPEDTEIDFSSLEIQQVESLLEQEDNSLDPVISEDDALDIYSTRSHHHVQKNYKIQEVVKKGQVLLVQAQKEEKGNKGATFTTFVSLAGKHCVLIPNRINQHGISKRITDKKERERLKKLLQEFDKNLNGSAASVIIRTSGEYCSIEDLKNNYNYLVVLWNNIRNLALNSIAPSFIHQEEGIIQRTMRDVVTNATTDIIISGDTAYENAKVFMDNMLPEYSKKITKHKASQSIFSKYDVERKISSLYQPIVTLPSGGYIVINPTEALTSIDVNSGKSIGEKNIEETAFKTNIEAAKVIVREIILRNISGLVVIDFIDMYQASNKRLLEKVLSRYFKKDKARVSLASISIFGLLELSRQRVYSSFLEQHSTICKNCNGKGVTRAPSTNSNLILRTIESEVADNLILMNVYTHNENITCLLNSKKDAIFKLENLYDIKINFYTHKDHDEEGFYIEKHFVKGYKSKNSKSKKIKPDKVKENNPISSINMSGQGNKLKQANNSFKKKKISKSPHDAVNILKNDAVKTKKPSLFNKILNFI